MICPNSWVDCEDCDYISLVKTCLYPSNLDIVVLAAKIAEEITIADAIESAEKIRGTWMEELDQVTGTEEFWAWFYKGRRPGDINYKESLIGGPSEPGGGAKNKAKKSKTGNKVYVDVWSGF